MGNKKMLYIWMFVIVIFLLFLAYNINSKAVPQALLAITIAIAIALNFFAEKEQFEDEQTVPYFLKNDLMPLLSTSIIDNKKWAQKYATSLNTYLYHHGNAHNDHSEFRSDDVTEMIILFCLHDLFKDVWCYSNYKEYSVPLSSTSQVHSSFDEKKKFKIIEDKYIRELLSDNTYIKYSTEETDFSFCVPPGTHFFRKRHKNSMCQEIEINIKKQMFFNITIKIRPLIGSENLSFLEGYFKPATTPKGGHTDLASIYYKVEFSRLAKGSSEMEDYRKWAYNVVKMLKSEITDLDDLKKKYIDYCILYPGATY